MNNIAITMTVNGKEVTEEVEPRLLLSDFFRDHLDLTGTNVGCEHGVCGACTIMVDGKTARSCLMLAVQADGCSIETEIGRASCRERGSARAVGEDSDRRQLVQTAR